jgi:hypothetical protein
MKPTYEHVTADLQARLTDYKPTPTHHRTQRFDPKSKPKENIPIIRERNTAATPEQFASVYKWLHEHCPDTLERDLIALAGIQAGIRPIDKARQHKVSESAMYRAYTRVHLLLAAQGDSSVTPRRIKKQRRQPFELTPITEPLVKQVAEEIMALPNPEVMMIALYGVICNLTNRALARDFGIPTTSLGRAREKIHGRFSQLPR